MVHPAVYPTLHVFVHVPHPRVVLSPGPVMILVHTSTVSPAQMPSSHVDVALHVFPHVPQFLGSLANALGLTHLLPQHTGVVPPQSVSAAHCHTNTGNGSACSQNVVPASDGFWSTVTTQ
jgi:hypothetical protein